jgi:hypothetical protein
MMLWEFGRVTRPLSHPPSSRARVVRVQPRDPIGVLLILKEIRSMTNATATQPKPNPLPAILVYGTPSSPALTQASWFRAEDREAVKAAAEALKFSVIELLTDADRALAAGSHEGVLRGSGRMIVGSVSSEVYRRIEEHVRKAAGGPGPSKPDSVAVTTTKPAQEQSKNAGAAGAISPGLAPASLAAQASDKTDGATARETLRVGARVLAAYFNEKREFEGFWLATVKGVEHGEFILEWFDADYPAFRRRPQDIAVPHPEFRVSGK